MKTHVIQLESHDDVISIKDKMTWQACRRIVLVWPKRGKILASELDLVLLERTARQLGAEIALVTHHPVVREWALEKGIPLFASITAAERSAWKPVPATIQEKRFTQGTKAIQVKKLALPKINSFEIHQPILRKAVLGVSLAAVLALLLVILPKADIIYYPEITPQEIEIRITASEDYTGINPSGGIPASVVSTEVSGELSRPSSGRTTVETSKASGKITLTNLTQNAISMSKGTLLLAGEDDSLFFLLTGDVKLPAGIGKTLEADAEALLPGADGNVEAGRITSVAGEASALVSVTNENAFSGGRSLEAAAPAETDYTVLRNLLLEQLQQEGLTNLASNLEPDKSLINESIHVDEILIEERVNEVDRPSDEAVLRMTVKLKALMIKQADLKSIATLILDANCPDGYRSLSENVEIQRTGEAQFDENGQVSWTIKAYRLITPQWDANQAAALISGKSIKKAKVLFEDIFYQTQPARFKTGWPWTPFLSTRIHFVNGVLQ